MVDVDLSVATRIRDRLRAAGKRFHANDSIAEFVEPGEVQALQREVEEQLKGVLQALLEELIETAAIVNRSA